MQQKHMQQKQMEPGQPKNCSIEQDKVSAKWKGNLQIGEKIFAS